jgi:hypothetical protein
MVSLPEERRNALRLFEKVVREAYGNEMEKVAEGWRNCVMRSLIFCALQRYKA